MNDVYLTAKLETGLTPEEISDALLQSLAGRSPKKVLILPPGFHTLPLQRGLYHQRLLPRADRTWRTGRYSPRPGNPRSHDGASVEGHVRGRPL